MAKWNFFTNHGHVLFVLGGDPKLTLREIAEQVGVTERATQKIISDLEEEGYIKIKKVGRNNVYKVNGRKKLRHPIEEHCRIGELMKFIGEQGSD